MRSVWPCSPFRLPPKVALVPRTADSEACTVRSTISRAAVAFFGLFSSDGHPSSLVPLSAAPAAFHPTCNLLGSRNPPACQPRKLFQQANHVLLQKSGPLRVLVTTVPAYHSPCWFPLLTGITLVGVEDTCIICGVLLLQMVVND